MRNLDTPRPFPINTPTTKAGKEALRLHDESVRQYERIAKLERDQAAAKDASATADRRLAAALVEAEKAGGRPTKFVKDAEAALADSSAVVNQPWIKRIEAAAIVARQAADALSIYTDENLDELLSEPELFDSASEAQIQIKIKAEELAQALGAWAGVSYRHGQILSPAGGIDNQAIPSLPNVAVEMTSAVQSYLLAEDENRGVPAPRPIEAALAYRRAEAAKAIGLDS